MRKLLPAMLLMAAPPTLADVAYVVKGVDDELQSNIESHVASLQFGPRARLQPHRYDDVIEKAVANARRALRPFGYYAPEITGRVIPGDNATDTVELSIEPGPPVRIASVELGIDGAGARSKPFVSWRDAWPLTEGKVLNQAVWEEQKRAALEIADARGHLAAGFTETTIAIDLEQNTAALRLILDTGPRYVMGDVDFGEHLLKPGILEYIPRFNKGTPYTARLVSRLRTDLWRTGYFDDVQVTEIERPDYDPPAVDFDVDVVTETRNHYQGALGFGTDTGIRLQASWSKNPMSSSGDRFDLGIGYQEQDDQFTLRGRYQKPRLNRARQWWDTELTLRFENLDIEVRRNPEDEELIRIGNGDLAERHLRFGRLKLRNQKGGEAQQFDTLFAQYLNSELRFNIGETALGVPVVVGNPDFNTRLKTVDNALSLGGDIEIIDVHGRRFETAGHRDKAWVFHSDKAFGSEVEFTQFYLSTRRSYLLGDRLKFLLRAEAGYTEADVDEFVLDIGGEPLSLSLTRLPNFYRFKAGGSMSVRGYGFEALSNNDVGSNNILTASAEFEYRFLDSWSGAAFYDIGNAFNDWNNPEIKRGIGVGIRWYSIAGEIRVDVAKALDFEGRPLRVHLTIGTPLL